MPNHISQWFSAHAAVRLNAAQMDLRTHRGGGSAGLWRVISAMNPGQSWMLQEVQRVELIDRDDPHAWQRSVKCAEVVFEVKEL